MKIKAVVTLEHMPTTKKVTIIADDVDVFSSAVKALTQVLNLSRIPTALDLRVKIEEK